ncbi:MAG: cupin domain-containing protein [Candidatus Omnitrophica bacterium]|nr:cupin domain-containing protein [Candidatus Omnitrophota bacterium]
MDDIKVHNIYTNLSPTKGKEVFEKLAGKKGLRIERITSLGQSTPAGKWLKSKKNEWVILLKGKAKLRFRTADRIIDMDPGDYIFIPDGVAHRVDWTTPKEKSVWVAVMF